MSTEAAGWDAAPLRRLPTSNGRGVKVRRDLKQLDPAFLADQIERAWESYRATYYARNDSIGKVIFDAEDVESELRMMLVEAATRYNPTRGEPGNFARFAAGMQRAHLLEISRRRMGRGTSDAAIAASRGEPIPDQRRREIDAFHNHRTAVSHDRICPARNTTRGNTMPTALKAVEDGKRPHPKQLLDHPDARIRRAAQKVMDAVANLDAAWEANAEKAELRAKRDRLKKQLAEIEAQIKGTAPAAPKVDYRAVREWAIESGHHIAAVGRPPQHIVDAYNQAHGGGAA